jgi:hypothetical protein
MEVWVPSWDRHKNVVGLNWLKGMPNILLLIIGFPTTIKTRGSVV